MFAGITMTAAGWSVISLIMLIYHAICLVFGERALPAVATIKELKEKNDDNLIIVSTTYTYSVDVLCDGKTYSSEWVEQVDKGSPSEYSIGQEITVRFYPKKAKIAEKTAVNKVVKWAKRLGIGVVVCILSELLAFLVKKLLLG